MSFSPEGAAAAAAGGAYLPLFAFEDVIEKTVERYGIINFLLILMVGTLLFSLALVAFILALATYVSIIFLLPGTFQEALP